MQAGGFHQNPRLPPTYAAQAAVAAAAAAANRNSHALSMPHQSQSHLQVPYVIRARVLLEVRHCCLYLLVHHLPVTQLPRYCLTHIWLI
jgi:hypothetical protein